MTSDTVHRLLSFLRANGNVLALAASEGTAFHHEKRYEAYDKEGRGKGSPSHVLTIDPVMFREATALLGSDTFRTRDGNHLVLAARRVAASEKGEAILQVAGLRTGCWHLHVERGYLAVQADGRSKFTRTERGARRKLYVPLKDAA